MIEGYLIYLNFAWMPEPEDKTKKIWHLHSNTTIRHQFFSNRVCNLWNSLPYEVVEAVNLNLFKNRLDKHWCGRSFRFQHDVNPFEITDIYRSGISGY